MNLVAVGAGRMGRGIALAFALAKRPITLLDVRSRTHEETEKLWSTSKLEIQNSLEALVNLNVIKHEEMTLAINSIEFVNVHDAEKTLGSADMVFECVTETLQAKESIFRLLSDLCRSEAILTSTTSSILVTEIEKWVVNPGRFLNMHWLNPAYVIPVVELSVHTKTTIEVLDKVKSLLIAIDKIPVVCGAAPGYIVPRLQALIMNEAARMIEEGVATAEEIDKATRFGLGLRFAAMGVVEFIDFGGIDILHHASREMSKSIDPHRYEAPQILSDHLNSGHLGFKSGKGFLEHDQAKASSYREDVLRRTISLCQHFGLMKKS
jgi:3-hydroxybutyryl-CoA dehydrogenase